MRRNNEALKDLADFLEEVQESEEFRGQRHLQSLWYRSPADGGDFDTGESPYWVKNRIQSGSVQLICGSTACAAGWAVINSSLPAHEFQRMSWFTAGAKALGIDADLASVIFHQRNELLVPHMLRKAARGAPINDIMETFDDWRNCTSPEIYEQAYEW